MNNVELYDLGLKPYREAWDLQKRIQERLIAGKLAMRDNSTVDWRTNDTFLLVEHPHVYTLGKSGNRAHLLAEKDELVRLNAEFIENDRGGDITYHGPGQIVGYPILDLDRHFTDIHRYLRSLEEVIIRVAAEFGVSAGRVDGLTGVWAEGKKFCAMGIRCSRWVTMHGFALNVDPDLSYFSHIVPCGIQERPVTSLAELAGTQPDQDEIKRLLCLKFADVFDVEYLDGQELPESEGQFSYLPAYGSIPGNR